MADLLGYQDPLEIAAARDTVPVLLPLALDSTYDYLLPPGEALQPGDFVLVPIGPRKEVGVVWERDENAKPVDPRKLKAVIDRFELPPLPEAARRFADWVARYTLSPRGMVLKMMMSAADVFSPDMPRWGYKLAGPPPARLTAERKRAIEAAEGGLVWAKSALAERAGVSSGVIDGLAQAGTLIRVELPRWRPPSPQPDFAPPDLTDAQAYAAHALRERVAAGEFLGVADRRRHRLGQDGGLFRGRCGKSAAGAPDADPASRNRAHEPVSAALRGAFRLPSAGMAFGDFIGRAGAHLAGRRRGRGSRSSPARARRCSCPFPISASSSSMRSTTPPSSRRTASPIRAATWPWCAARLPAPPSFSARRRRRSKPLSTRKAGAMRIWCCRSAMRGRKCPKFRPSTCARRRPSAAAG